MTIEADSQGGLLVRWMLYRINAHDAAFPNALYVQQVITTATPHNGATAPNAVLRTCSAADTTQGCEDRTGSDFLSELNKYALNPQGTGGTDWSLMGSAGDLWVPADSAINMGGVHKVVYRSVPGAGCSSDPPLGAGCPPSYNHGDYYKDDSRATDATVDRWDPPANTKTSGIRQQPHGIAWIMRALTSFNW